MSLEARTESFLGRAEAVHSRAYDYSSVEYRNAHQPVDIGCPRHGVFKQSPNNHLKGQGCPECGLIKRKPRGKTITEEMFKEASFKAHQGVYQYVRGYSGSRSVITLRCGIHGEFKQRADAHLRGAVCGFCHKSAAKNALGSGDFWARVRKTHGDRYEYLSGYSHSLGYLSIKCKHHGVFEQRAYDHGAGAGCPSCVTPISKAEQQIADFLKHDLILPVDQQFRIGRSSFDIKVNSVLIEYHGLHWHSTATIPVETEARRKHETKRQLAEDHGFRYVAIYEDEWRDNRPVVEQYLISLFGKAQTTGARKLDLAEVSSREARAFYAKHHLLGAGAARGKHMALLDNGKIAACMSIGKASEIRGETDWYSLSRFCTDGRNIAGAASRLLKAFGDTPKLVSYIDLDKFTGDIYRTLGFTLDGYIDPDYMTVWPGAIRKHKTSTRKDRLAKLPGFNAELTEFANCDAMGIHRIYHSGRVRVVRYTTPR